MTKKPTYEELEKRVKGFEQEALKRRQMQKQTELLSSLKEDLLRSAGLTEKLKRITDGIVEILNADFSRIWLIKPGDLCDSGCIHAKITEGPHVCQYREHCLHLQVSSGRYTHIDGEVHQRVPFGCYKIGRIASEEDTRFITNHVIHDSRVHHHKWAKKLGLVSFAGYRLLSASGDPIGVLALFSKHIISEDEDTLLEDLASTTAYVIQASKANEALRESKAKYRTVLEANPDPVVVYDMEGKVIYLNPAFTRVFGWSLKERMGKKMDDFVPEENWPETKMMIERVTVSGERFSGLETRRYTKEGKIIPVSISGSFYRDQEDNIAASVINLRDISNQKRLEAQLQHAQKMEAIGTLAGGIAHEFNNTLTGVVGNIQLLEMALPDNEIVRKHCEAMKGPSHRMADLTNHLLAYAEGGRYQPRVLSMSDFVKDSLPIITPDVDPAIHIETDLPRDISPVKADTTQMQMVLSAVLNNAVESIEGDGRIRIEARNLDLQKEVAENHPGRVPDRYVCLTVADDGAGMDEKTRSRIFDPFFSTKFQGRGMGMAAAYGIVINHGGWISVGSEPGQGTVVEIYLPAAAAAAKEKKLQAPEVKIITDTGTILVIEDEAMVMDVLRAILERLGYRILAAKTGKEAIDIAKSFDGQIDLALLDIKLSDMSGENVYPLIMEARPNLKVLVCSGYAIDGPAQEILDAGAQGFIQKPFSLADLSQKMRKILDKE